MPTQLCSPAVASLESRKPVLDGAVKRSHAVFPAGCNGEFNLPPELSRVIVRGEGCRLTTSDGGSMLDFSMGWGSVLPGHSAPEVVAAVRAQAERGMNFAYVTEQSLELAEEIVRLSPACEKVRFCASGTEATMYCLRLARAFTGRRKILKFEGAYHGAHDVGVASLFPSEPADYPRCQPSSAGVNLGGADDILVVPFNDLSAAKQVFAEHDDRIAAAIVEPLQRCVPPASGFLEGLRALTAQHGALLAFDEVVTGFRLAYGGAQEYYGVVPDLVAYGKALGGGAPIGAFGGRVDVMDLTCEDRMGRATYVWTASTLGGNPVSTAAASAALRLYRAPGVYQRLQQHGELLRAGMREALAVADIEGQILGDGPIAQVCFAAGIPRDYRTTRHDRPEFARRVMLELFSRGIFLNPMGTKLYLSLAHTPADCDEFCEKFLESLRAAA